MGTAKDRVGGMVNQIKQEHVMQREVWEKAEADVKNVIAENRQLKAQLDKLESQNRTMERQIQELEGKDKEVQQEWHAMVERV